ncbi:MAG: hypothetical protein JW847_03850 [Candidatus Omnitrophica bacterium]|nr:hypothetical protein [Candidatus Omnitrophota bacterium]
MNSNKKYLLAVLIACLLLTQSGCALLKAPVMILGGVFKFVGNLLKIASRLPMPPPGVF